MNAKALKALLQKFRSLPPHFRYPLLAVGAVVILVAAHAVFDRPATPPATHVASSVMPPCEHLSSPQYETYHCQHSVAVAEYKAANPAAICHFQGQVVGCGCPPDSRCAANAKWRALIARESVGAVPPLPAASTKPAPATTTASTVASVSTAAAPVPVAPVQPPEGVRAGLLHVVTEGRDQFGAWLTLTDRTIKSPTLTLAIPAMPSGAAGARRLLVSAWVHVTKPVQTVTLREVGAASVSLAVAGQDVSIRGTYGEATSRQVVVNLVSGWYLVKATGTEGELAGASRVEVQLGSTNLNPVIPVPYWTPARATAKPATPSTKATPAPAPAATAAAPRAAHAVTKGQPVPVPVKAGTARKGQVPVKEQKP